MHSSKRSDNTFKNCYLDLINKFIDNLVMDKFVV